MSGETESIRSTEFSSILEGLYGRGPLGFDGTLSKKLTEIAGAYIGRKMRTLLALYSEAKRCERWVEAAQTALNEQDIADRLFQAAIEAVESHDKSVKQRKVHEAEAEKAETGVLPAALVRGYYEAAAKAHSTDADHFAASTKAQQYKIERDAAELRALRDVDYISKSISESLRHMIHRLMESDAKRFKSHASALKEMAKITEPQTDDSKKGGLLAMLCAPAREAHAEAL